MSYTVIFTRPADSNNYTMNNGTTKTFTFNRTSGNLPPAGATLKNVNVSFSNIVIYAGITNAVCQFGNIGNFHLASDTSSDTRGEQSGSLTNVNSANALTFAGGGLALTTTRNGSGTGCASIRSNCSITISITYDVTTVSTGSLTSTTVMQGKNIGMSISAADSSFTHKIKWRNSAGTEQTIDYGTNRNVTYTVPSSWTTGAATATLYTYNGSNLIGSNQYSFAVTIDGSTVFPTTGNLTITRVRSQYVPQSWGIYVKGLDKATVALNNATAGTQAAFSQIMLTCGTQSQTTTSAKSFTTSEINESGIIECTGKVTNSFGNSANAGKVSITVYDYSDPQITSIQAFRCKSATDSTPMDNGKYIAVSVQVNYSSVNGKNSIATLTAQYKKTTATAWSAGTAVTNGGTTIIGGNIPTTDESMYEVRIVAVDQIQNLKGTYSSRNAAALIADSIIHILNGGLNVSIGKEGSRQNAFEVNGDWAIYHGDTRIDGTIPINRGGTGATNAQTARTNLGITPAAIGAAATTHSHALSDCTGTLPISKGGTGVTTAANALSALGGAASDHKHSAGDITSGTIAQARLPFNIRWGTVSITSSWSAITFSPAMPKTPYVVCTYTDNAATSGINVIKTDNRSATGFSVCTAGSNSTARTICWIAIC